MNRTLHILPTLDPVAGGMSQAVRNIISYASSKDVVHEVLCMCKPDENFIKGVGFTVHAVGPGVTAWFYNRNLKSWLRDNINIYQNIIVHGLWQYQSYAIVNVWRSLACKPKLYVMPHGMLDPYFQRAAGRKLKAIRNLFFWELVEKKLVNSADALLFTSKQEEILAANTFQRYRPQKTSTIGLGVKMPPPAAEIFTHKSEFRNSQPPEKPYWLFLGRLHPKKGVEMLITAYLQLKKTNSELPSLVIAGPGLETSYGKKIVQLAAVEPQILFPGMLEGSVKWTALYGAEVFILSSHQENYGIAVVEAMACGTPVLISDKVNICADVLEAHAGFVAPDTEEGTVGLLKNWLELNAEDRQKLRRNAEKLYSVRFAEQVVTQNMISLLLS